MYAHQSISSVHRLGSKLFDRPSYIGDTDIIDVIARFRVRQLRVAVAVVTLFPAETKR